jgi:hypothetical protein
MTELEYLRLGNNDVMPPLSFNKPFKCVLVVDSFFSAAWQAKICARLVKSGCRYLMVSGASSGSWYDVLSHLQLEQFEYRDIPAEALVMTSGYRHESLADAFAFCRNKAKHALYPLSATLLLHISDQDKSAAMRQAYALVNSLYLSDRLFNRPASTQAAG